MISKFSKLSLALATAAIIAGTVTSCNLLSTLGKITGTWTLQSSTATMVDNTSWNPSAVGAPSTSNDVTETTEFSGGTQTITSTEIDDNGFDITTTVEEWVNTINTTLQINDDGTFSMTSVETPESYKLTVDGSVITNTSIDGTTSTSTSTGNWNYDNSEKGNDRISMGTDIGGAVIPFVWTIVENKKGSLILANDTESHNSDVSDAGVMEDHMSYSIENTFSN